MKAVLHRLPWWAVGLLAAVLTYAALGLGLLAAHAVTDPGCGLPGPEILVMLPTMAAHAWLGFFVALLIARPARSVDAFLLGIPVSAVACAVNVAGAGPAVYPAIRCEDSGARMLAGLVVTGVAAALLARRPVKG